TAATGGAGAGKAEFLPVQLNRLLDRGALALFKACASGAAYDKVELALRTRSGGNEPIPPFYTAKLKDVHVASVEWSGAAGGGKWGRGRRECTGRISEFGVWRHSVDVHPLFPEWHGSEPNRPLGYRYPNRWTWASP